MTQERIVAAAVFHGCTISLPPPARHHTILNFIALHFCDGDGVHQVNQGFLTSTGRFVNRTEGYYIAANASQIIHKTGAPNEPTLYSDDMW